MITTQFTLAIGTGGRKRIVAPLLNDKKVIVICHSPELLAQWRLVLKDHPSVEFYTGRAFLNQLPIVSHVDVFVLECSNSVRSTAEVLHYLLHNEVWRVTVK